MTLAAALNAPLPFQRYATNAQWRALVLDGLPDEVQGRALADARRIEAQPRTEFGAGTHSPAAKANGHIWRVADALGAVDFETVASESAIRERAATFAAAAAEWPAGVSVLLQVAGIEGPAGLHLIAPAKSTPGALARVQGQRWWRRKLRAAWGQGAENALRRVGHVRKGRAPYVSDYSLSRRREQRARGRDAMEGARLACGPLDEPDTVLPLLDVAKGSLANPAVRRAELMTRVRGFQDIADEVGHEAAFWTLTAPSAFHAWHAQSGDQNARFEGGTVDDGRAWLQRIWARVRAKFAREGLQLYGFRVAEPHHDATPHWHLLLFGSVADLSAARKIIADAWLKEYGDEPGAATNRVKVKRIDRAEGSAVGYIAKYIAKNLDGHGLDGHGRADDDEAELPVDEGTERVEAWASTHGIRQFQQIGGPPVGLWRELRRLREPVACAAIERARLAADAGDWRAFVREVGGIAAGRSTNVRVWMEVTGEQNAYGEVRGAVPAGVECGVERFRTRDGAWRIEWGKCQYGADRRRAALGVLSSLGPVAITVRGALPHRLQHVCANLRVPSGRHQHERAMRRLE